MGVLSDLTVTMLTGLTKCSPPPTAKRVTWDNSPVGLSGANGANAQKVVTAKLRWEFERKQDLAKMEKLATKAWSTNYSFHYNFEKVLLSFS